MQWTEDRAPLSYWEWTTKKPSTKWNMPSASRGCDNWALLKGAWHWSRRDRSMTIRIGEHQADPVKIVRGSPQGSVLGCLLYCVTTQLLTHDLRNRLVPGGQEGEEDCTAAFLYVDDTTLFDAVPMTQVVRHCTTNKTKEVFMQPRIGGDFDELADRAEDIGMAINGKKTQLLVLQMVATRPRPLQQGRGT